MLGNIADYRKNEFANLVKRSEGKDCLQIGVRNKKYAPHWVSVDKYDTADYIDYQYDAHDMPFEDASFDIVVCNAVLEHVENPFKVVSELHRVLRPNGEIWVEIPFNQPYHPSPGDFWRVSPDGMLILMQDFKPIKSGNAKIDGSDIYNVIVFHGMRE